MPDVKTDDKEPFTDGDLTEAQMLAKIIHHLDALSLRVDHMDEGIHALDRRMSEVTEFFAEHRSALARAASLLDTGSKMRGFLGGKPAKEMKHGG